MRAKRRNGCARSMLPRSAPTTAAACSRHSRRSSRWRDGLPLAALPNIGLASLSGGRVIYPHAAPEYFAEFAAHARKLGARLIGGCCGTTPTEIAAIRAAVEEAREPRSQLEFSRARAGRGPRRGAAGDGACTGASRGRVRRLGSTRPTARRLRTRAPRGRARLSEGGVRFVDVNDNATARAGMSSLMVSARIERETGLETVPHLTTRDWTVLGIESMLLGAHAEGVRNVLAITGDPPEVGDYPGSRGVWEIDAIGLTQLITRLNRGEDFNGRPIDAPTSFFTGVAVNPTADDLEHEADRFRRKIEAGAKYAMTQIVFDLDALDRFAEVLGGSWPVPVLAGIFPLTSHRLALRLHNEVPGIIVPAAAAGRPARAGGTLPRLASLMPRSSSPRAGALRRRLRRRAVQAPGSGARADLAAAGRDRAFGAGERAADGRSRHAVAGFRADSGGENRRLDLAAAVDDRPA